MRLLIAGLVAMTIGCGIGFVWSSGLLKPPTLIAVDALPHPQPRSPKLVSHTPPALTKAEFTRIAEHVKAWRSAEQAVADVKRKFAEASYGEELPLP